MPFRRTTGNSIAALLLGVLIIGGCQSAPTEITVAPEDWSEYAGRTITIGGNAGNSAQGMIVRLENGYIPLLDRRKWGIDLVGRPVLVTGKVVSGKGFREDKYVLEVTDIQVPQPEQQTPRRTNNLGVP